jgi:hypothetical protein
VEAGEAIFLLLRIAYGQVAPGEGHHEDAAQVTKHLGYLALAIAQAGAYVQQGMCSLREYCEIYTQRRKELLEYLPIRSEIDYRYAVYTAFRARLHFLPTRKRYQRRPMSYGTENAFQQKDNTVTTITVL